MAIGVVSNVTESLVNRATLRRAFANILIFAFLGLVGGVAFDALRSWFGLEHRDTAYALLVMATYVALAILNLGLVTVDHPGVRRRILSHSRLPALPIELLSGLMLGFEASLRAAVAPFPAAQW